jgi:peptidoglycan hydrolase CwlO-like protein
MSQESYADFSIVQKYLDQKRYHDEALKKHQSRITELESNLTTMQSELDAKDQAIIQLKGKLKETTSQLTEKEHGMQELNTQLHRFKTQQEHSAPEENEPFIEDAVSKKGKFGFLKK